MKPSEKELLGLIGEVSVSGMHDVEEIGLNELPIIIDGIFPVPKLDEHISMKENNITTHEKNNSDPNNEIEVENEFISTTNEKIVPDPTNLSAGPSKRKEPILSKS